MDPITHGIAGVLLGKGYFADRKGAIAIFALTLGAVFPDVDEVAVAFSHDPLAIVKYHRGITHSFVAMPAWAALLALGTVWAAKRLKIAAPSWAALTAIYIAGIASHIVLDGMTSFGTRMWLPISNARVAWDVLFIVDLAFTAVLLLPQLAAWTYSRPHGSRGRAAWSWVVLTILDFGGWLAARAFGAPFRLWLAIAASAAIATACFLPAVRGWGFGVKRSRWCRAGVYVAVAYLLCCFVAHRSALRRVRAFAEANRLGVLRLAAIPSPPSLLNWSGEIRASNGVYEAQLDLRDMHGGNLSDRFTFIPDSPPDPYIARAMKLPQVHLYWHFARFPVIRSAAQANGGHAVFFYETRFRSTRSERPEPFTYEVQFDSAGKLSALGWKRNGMLHGEMQPVSQQPGGAPR